MPARLIECDWPDPGRPPVPAAAGLEEMRARLADIRRAMAGAGLDALVIYGDREHAANLRWATGFDPRFEEALLIVGAEGRPVLVVGNECLPYAGVSPLVAAGDVGVVHCASLSLVSQPRGGERLDTVLAAHVPRGGAVGTAGWKYYEPAEVQDPATAIEVPALVVDLLRAIAGRVVNATALFMHPGQGLRSRVSLAEVARLEFANHMAASALRRMVFSFREGMTDFEAVEAAHIGGLPLGCHPTFATGGRAGQGLSGPTGERLHTGSAISFNICHWGANICRAGWLARGAGDLPPAARDYLDAFVGPYMAALSDWFSLMRPGTSGGDVWARMMAALPAETFGVTLNPGHLIGDDEWISSPVFAGSVLPIASGMAMQCDVIPESPVYGSTRMEDGYVILDAEGRAALAAGWPELFARCRSRQRFMRGTIGLDVPDDLLPLADTCGVLAPYLFSPRLVVSLA